MWSALRRVAVSASCKRPALPRHYVTISVLQRSPLVVFGVTKRGMGTIGTTDDGKGMEGHRFPENVEDAVVREEAAQQAAGQQDDQPPGTLNSDDPLEMEQDSGGLEIEALDAYGADGKGEGEEEDGEEEKEDRVGRERLSPMDLAGMPKPEDMYSD